MKKFALAAHESDGESKRREPSGEAGQERRKRRSSIVIPFEGASPAERRDYFYKMAGADADKVRSMFEGAMQRIPERSLRFGAEPMIGGDVRRLAGVAGHRTEMDTAWVMGVHPYQRTDFRSATKVELKEPDRAILIRYILGFPDRDILPKLPDAQTTYDKVAAIWPRILPYSRGEELNPKTFAILCGYNGANGYRWLSRNGKPGPLSYRVFYVLCDAIDHYGENGLRDYLSVLESEAYSRLGVPLEVIFDAGGWSVVVLEQYVKQLAAGGKRRRRRTSRSTTSEGEAEVVSTRVTSPPAKAGGARRQKG